jgi:hypothetical protein
MASGSIIGGAVVKGGRPARKFWATFVHSGGPTSKPYENSKTVRRDKDFSVKIENSLDR